MTLEGEDHDFFLFAQIRLGKEEAFDYIFRKYYKTLVIHASRYVHVQDTAQSLVQDCFVKFWEKRLELTNIEDIHSYLFFMVRNKCIDHLRENKQRRQIPIGERSEFTDNEVVEKIDADDLSTHLWQTIACLPERCRLAFEYSRIDGLTYFQIAQKMGISDKAVEALISRGLKILRSKLVDFLGILLLLCL